MDLQPLRCFVRMVELGSVEHTALDLQMSLSTLGETIAGLQRTLPFELLQHADDAVLPTAVLYGTDIGRRWHVSPLVEERLFVVQSTRHPTMPLDERAWAGTRIRDH